MPRRGSRSRSSRDLASSALAARDRAVGIPVRMASSTAACAGVGSSSSTAAWTTWSRAARPGSRTISVRMQQLVVGGGQDRPVEGQVRLDRIALAARRRRHQVQGVSSAARSSSVRRRAARPAAAGSMIPRSSARSSKSHSSSRPRTASGSRRRRAASTRSRGCTNVPRFWRASIRPFAFSTRRASRITERLTSSSASSSASSRVCPSSELAGRGSDGPAPRRLRRGDLVPGSRRGSCCRSCCCAAVHAESFMMLQPPSTTSERR